nr:hypothetical protein [Parafrankia discariae]
MMSTEDAPAPLERVTPEHPGLVSFTQRVGVPGQVVGDMKSHRMVGAERSGKPAQGVPVYLMGSRHLTQAIQIEPEAVRHPEGARVIGSEYPPGPV